MDYFQPNKITKASVLKAAKKLDEKSRLRSSALFDVIINDKAYPPKEIVRLAHTIATGNDFGIPYSNEEVKDILENLAFSIIQKKSLWKLGCNWGRGAPSFYNFIKENQIIISADKHDITIGDLIIITEGFTVYAIAKVKSVPIPITTRADFKEDCEDLKIDFEDWVTFAEAEWYELSETEVFKYEIQKGICKVLKSEVVEDVVNIWENKDIVTRKTWIYSMSTNGVEPDWRYPCIVFSKTGNIDNRYKTTFEAFLFKSASERFILGTIKILDKNTKDTVLSKEINQLGRNFATLGQTLDFYKNLKVEFPRSYEQILRRINDCGYYNNIKLRFNNQLGLSKSLLKSTEAENIYRNIRSLLEGSNVELNKNFTFTHKIKGAIEAHRVDFNFEKELLSRFFCIVGKNGTGKTSFISQLANKLIDQNEEGEFYPDRPNYSKIIATSFSYFDNFKFPSKEDQSYSFIGIKSKNGILTETEAANLTWNAFVKLSEDKKKKKLWTHSISNTLETEYLNFPIVELGSISTKKEFNEKTEAIFSSGQKILFQFITRLISSIEDNSLLIFDEPETHLHPNIAGRLIRVINFILEAYNSFCILSTHSPVILQEIPSRFIRILDRHENFPTSFQPPIECLGENLSNISNAVFHTDQEKELHKTILENLLLKRSVKEVDKLFNNKLSLNAKLYLELIKNQSNA